MESKYKAGDKVKVKSLDWYNSYKDEYGDIVREDTSFLKVMSALCGKELEVSYVFPDGECFLKGNGWIWADWMFEGKPTFNKKN